MVISVTDDRQLFRRAVAASVALHVLLALLLPSWIRSNPEGLQPVETLSFAHLIRLEIRRPLAHAPVQAVPQAQKRSPVATFAHVRSQLSAPSQHRETVPRPVAAAPGVSAAAPKVSRTRIVPLYVRTSTTPLPVAADRSQATASPDPAAAAGDREVTGAAADRGGIMPLGAEQEPVLDPRVIATLQQRVGTHVTLVVTVSEDGRTQHVSFDPPLDAQTEKTVEAILADADWDAAVCGGGVSCQGTATIKL